MKFTPHKYQQIGIKWLVSHPEAALFWAPGLGKTSVTVAAFQALQKAGGCKRALIVAPLRVAQMVWSKDGELGKWEDFSGLKVHLLHGADKESLLPVEAMPKPDIYVINFDGLQWLIESGALDRLIKAGVDTLIIDEISKMKHTKTKRFKLLKPYLGRFKRRWGLTGSPASNGLLDLFGQLYTLDLGQSLGKFITHYRYRYFTPIGFRGFQWALKPGAGDEIYKAISGTALSMKAEDHLDLPGKVEQNIWVDLPPKARKTYDDLEEDLIIQINKEVVTAANAAVASMKCRQIASGGIYLDAELDQKRKTIKIHDEKTSALVDLVEELQGAPLLIAYEFDHDLQRIRTALGEKTPAINGATSMLDTQRLVSLWNLGELPLLCGHPAAMGHGLNLQGHGNHICWYSLTWNFELYDQLIRRVWRQGQKNRVIVHRILARKTVDVAVMKALASKKRGQNALFEALKELGK